ncbi:MFS transporter [Sphingomonas sp. OTU376]|uniref:MFS transporter n=1 Tax=Sphingomonas sp. OTU376 TaxID=3043863 RepID=UPI00313D53D4
MRAHITVLWLAGVFAAAQLAKFTVLGPALRERFGFSLPVLGALVSLLELAGATLGLLSGIALGALGARRSLLIGVAMTTAFTVAEALALNGATIFAARAAEAVGYLLIVVGAPTMMIKLTSAGSARNNAMVLWSTFIPVGLGLGSILTGLLETLAGAQGAILAWSVFGIAVGVALLILPVAPDTIPPRSKARRRMPAAAAWLMTGGFGFYTLFLCAMTGLLPSFMLERHGATVTLAGLLVGLVALSALPGTALAMALVRMVGTSASSTRWIVATVSLIAALIAPTLYSVSGLITCAAVGAAVHVFAGVARTIIFSRLPAISGATGPEDPRMAASQGLLTQFGAAGALLGPPLGALVVERSGWQALGILVSFLILVMLALVWAGEALDSRRCRTSV